MADYVITTKNSESHPLQVSNFHIVSSVKEATQLTSKSVIILESSNDKPFDVLVFLVSAIQTARVSKFAYIAEKPIPIIDEVMKALKAFRAPLADALYNLNDFSALLISTNEHHLNRDSDTLSTLAESLSIVDKFMTEKLEAEPKASRRQIESAFAEVVEAMDKSVISDVLRDQIQTLVVDFLLSTKSFQDEIAQRERDISNLQATNLGGMGISSYQQYTYTGNHRVVVVKEHTPVQYLTSFLCAFADYMTTMKAVKTKLIIIDRDSDMVDYRYKELMKADADSIRLQAANLLFETCVYTTTPTRTILDSLMDGSLGTDLYIVLDRTYKKAEIISGRGVKVAHAVSSRRLMRLMEFDADETILNDLGEASQLVTIGLVDPYPNEKEARKATLQQAFERSFKDLASFAGTDIN